MQFNADELKAIRRRVQKLYASAKALARFLDSERLRDAVEAIFAALMVIDDYRAQLNEDALLRRAKSLATLLGKTDGCAVVIETSADKAAVYGVGFHGETLTEKNKATGVTSRIALEMFCNHAVAMIQHKRERLADSRAHDDRAWATWAEQRLAEIESEYSNEVVS